MLYLTSASLNYLRPLACTLFVPMPRKLLSMPRKRLSMPLNICTSFRACSAESGTIENKCLLRVKSVNKFPFRDFLLYLCITFQEATAVAVMGGTRVYLLSFFGQNHAKTPVLLRKAENITL